MSDIITKQKIANALGKLFEYDAYLLAVQVNERSLTHKLAVYLQEEFPGFDIDCEYNRDGSLPKVLFTWAKRSIRSDDLDGTTVFPDIIIHKRGGENHLVIEAKKSCNSNKDDIPKLQAYKSELGYKYAGFVVFPVDGGPIESPDSYVKMY